MTGRGRQRLMRPVERQPMRDWLSDKLNAKEIPGLEWVNKEQRIFRIKWCHGSRHGWTLKDSVLFEKWAQHSGRYNDGDPKRWKANFRCALNSLKDIQEVKDLSISKGQNAFRVYKMLEARKKTDKQKVTKRMKTEPETDYVPDDSKCGLKETIMYVRASARLAAQTTSVRSQADDQSGSSESESEGYQTDSQDEHYTDSVVDEPLPLSHNNNIHTCATATEIKIENVDTSSKIPIFDKIIPNFYKLEFGKSHCLPRHGSGFKVVQLKKEKPLTPIVEAFHVPLPNTLNSLTTDTTDHARRDSDLTIKSDLELSARYSSKQTTPSSRFSTRMTEYTTPAYHASTDESQYTAQQIATRDNSAILTFPDTPDGSDVSNDSNSNEYIEVTIYEEEVGDSVTGESTEGCIVLTDLSKSYVSSSSSTAQLNQSEDRQCIMNYRVNQATGSTIPYMYNPLTPP
ncbi:uncharacterized protein LOC132735977 isoform X2 [Ruditapes philippinarum]|uniref:uncharacterized protein LOC132735977 isoform X2 n=1 Tax=Ruditapes philippinarum TaxID=129788 RepID=UPI00295AA199|nr:uncharacterized protein LOC132735977 isoform X2 [Ruditapes philippinarum]